MLSITSLIWMILILSITTSIDSILGYRCVDTIGWHDKINQSTCLDYVDHGWCVDKSLSSAMKVHSNPSLNFPELNCCACGKKASLSLSSTARWAKNTTTVVRPGNESHGSPFNGLRRPGDITIDDNNTLYIADTYNSRIVSIPLNSIPNTTAIGQRSQLNTLIITDITGISVTRTSIYIAESSHYRVQKWSRNSSNPVTVAGIDGVRGDSRSLTTLATVWCVFVDNYANIFVCDSTNHRVMMFPWNSTKGTSGMIVAGTGSKGSGTNTLHEPANVFVNNNGVFYIADSRNHRIQKWNLGAREGVTVAGTGVGGERLSELHFPNTVLVDLNEYVYICDKANNRIMRWAPDAAVGECIAACSGVRGKGTNQLLFPDSMAFDSSGSLYVSDSVNDRIQKFQILDETIQSSTTTSSKINSIKSDIFIITMAIIFVRILL